MKKKLVISKTKSLKSLNFSDKLTPRPSVEKETATKTGKQEQQQQEKTVSFVQLYRYATCLDIFYMLCGLLFAIGAGVCAPLMMIYFGDATGYFVDYAIVLNQAANLTQPELDTAKSRFEDGIADFTINTCILGLVTIICSYFGTLCYNATANRQVHKIRTNYLQSVLNQDIPWYDVHKTGDFASTISENLMKIEDGIGEKVSILLYFLSSFAAGILLSFIKGWKLALVCAVSLPLSSASMGVISWISTKFSNKEIESYGAAGSVAEETFSAIRTVVAFEGQQKEIQRYHKHLKDARDNNIRRSLFTSISTGIMWFFMYGAIALSFWYGVTLVLEERGYENPSDITYTPANMITVFFSILNSTWLFGQCTPYFVIFGLARGAAAKIFEVIDNKPAINASKNRGVKSPIKGHIVFENVHFNYPSRNDVKILQGLNLTINPGDTVALVGQSGCGKSTTIQLIQRFYDPNSGRILIDGHDVNEYDLNWLRQNIGLVGQEPVLFDVTIAENIKYGNPNASQEQIIQSAKKANAHDFISNLPQGYDTLVGERGAQLSGGQKQRIAIARALVREPTILLLDEATSALDTNSEKQVQSALDSASNECTTIIIAHRLSTIKNAKRIVVINEGQVVEEGNHVELMKKKGAYFNLITSQLKSDEDEQEQEEERKKNNSGKGDELTEDEDAENDDDNNEENNITTANKQQQQQQQVIAMNGQNGIINNHNHKRESSNGVVNNGRVKSVSISSNNDTDKKIVDDEIEVQTKGTLWQVMKLNSPEWWQITIGCLSSILTGAALPVYSIVFGDIIGVLADPDNESVQNQANIYSIYFFVIGIVSGIANFFQMYMFSIAGEKLTLRVRKLTFEAMLKQEMGWYDKKDHGVGALCTRLSQDAASVQGVSGQPIGTVLNSLSTLSLAIGLSMSFDWKLALVSLSFFPFILIAIYLEQKVVQLDMRESNESLENAGKLAVEAIGNIRTVASLGCEEIFYELYIKQLSPYYNKSKKTAHIRGLSLGLARSLMFFSYAASIFYGGVLVVQDAIEYGIIFKVSEALITGAWSMGNAMAFTPNFQKALISSAKIFAFLQRVPLIKDAQNASTFVMDKGDIDYKDVCFSYPTRPHVKVLRKLNLAIENSKTIALVGQSGCGKSTIIQLLERFYDPKSGNVRIDKTNLKNITLSSLRAHLGIVSQEPNLFDRTIAENIAYGDNGRMVEMDEIINAAKNANIHNFIASLPLGYNTPLGQKGTQLSGGQKQRIAIARALVRNPKVLLLDEATSALDTESEKIVQEALDNAKKGRTCITIAHRLSTIQDADVICVINNGEVSEMGTHSELIALKGLYYKLNNMQH